MEKRPLSSSLLYRASPCPLPPRSVLYPARRSRPIVEESEEDEDPVLYGYMNFLCSALAASPLDIEDRVKARTGADVVLPSVYSSHQGVVKSRGKADGKGDRGAVAPVGGRGLIRELVEQCLFAMPRQLGHPLESNAFDEGDAGDEDEVRHGRIASRGSVCGRSWRRRDVPEEVPLSVAPVVSNDGEVVCHPP